jgi:hypothetical protein
MKPSFLRIFQEVNTEDGRGLLVSIETPHNGLYVEFDRAKATVWYGTDNAVEIRYRANLHKMQAGGRWISREYSLKDLEEWNKELKLDNTLEDLGI